MCYHYVGKGYCMDSMAQSKGDLEIGASHLNREHIHSTSTSAGQAFWGDCTVFSALPCNHKSLIHVMTSNQVIFIIPIWPDIEICSGVG